jgi:ATP-dependent RNA circularization protein (DNA/RNA ligase family)
MRICTEQVRDKHDRVIVTEKLDGSCCAVAMLADGKVVALTRAGYLATSSPYPMHHTFDKWVSHRRGAFSSALAPGVRMVGEWIAVAHGTIYTPVKQPFIPFDVMRGKTRMSHDEARQIMASADLDGVAVIHDGEALPIADALSRLGPNGRYHAISSDMPEGAVWRVERNGRFDFMAKYVAPDKVDGKYLPTITGGDELVLWP